MIRSIVDGDNQNIQTRLQTREFMLWEVTLIYLVEPDSTEKEHPDLGKNRKSCFVLRLHGRATPDPITGQLSAHMLLRQRDVVQTSVWYSRVSAGSDVLFWYGLGLKRKFDFKVLTLTDVCQTMVKFWRGFWLRNLPPAGLTDKMQGLRIEDKAVQVIFIISKWNEIEQTGAATAFARAYTKT